MYKYRNTRIQEFIMFNAASQERLLDMLELNYPRNAIAMEYLDNTTCAMNYLLLVRIFIREAAKKFL